jgi:hypothetical protein
MRRAALVGGLLAVAVSPTAAASAAALRVSQLQAGDTTVVKLANAERIERAVVRWGDGASTISSRQCTASPDSTASRLALLLAPHTFARAGTYRASVSATRSCAGAATNQSVRMLIHVAERRVAAAAAVTPPTATAWTTFSPAYALADSRLMDLQGTVTPGGGCSMPGGSLSSSELAPGASTVEEREDAIDPSSCTYLMEIGTPPASVSTARSHAASNAETVGAASSSVTSPAKTASLSSSTIATNTGAVQAHAATVAYHQAFLYTDWEDPAFITVNSVTMYQNWYDNGTCVLSGSGQGVFTWYSPTGWFNFGGTTAENVDCYHANYNVYNAMGNHTFCLGQEVNSYYNENNLAGHYNGQWAANWNDYNTGAVCKDLLHFDDDAGYDN